MMKLGLTQESVDQLVNMAPKSSSYCLWILLDHFIVVLNQLDPVAVNLMILSSISTCVEQLREIVDMYDRISRRLLELYTGSMR